MISTQLSRIGTFAALMLGSVLSLGLVSSARAAVLAYEGFDYTVGAGLSGLNGGTGNWTSPWNDLQAAIGADVVQAGSLSYMDSMGNALQTTGGKLLNTGSAGTSQGGRSLTHVSTGSTWITFLAQRVGQEDGTPAGGVYPRGANLALFDLSDQSGANQERLDIGPKNTATFYTDNGVDQDYINFRYPALSQGVLESNLPNLTTTRPTPQPANALARDAFANELVQNVNLYVIRIDHLGDGMTADDVRVWINPRLDETPSDDAVSFAYIAADLQAAADTQMVPAGCTPGVDCSPYAALSFGDQSFDRIRMFAGAAQTDRPFSEILFDELRVATTFQEAAPIDGPAGTVGDYNNDGNVDAADYTVWRNNLGGAGTTLLNRDPANGMGVVDENDYASWKTHFGEPAGSGSVSSTGVPEPAAILLAGFGLIAAVAIRRRND